MPDDPPLNIDAREWLTANANYPLTIDEVLQDGEVEVVRSEVIKESEDYSG